MAYFLMHQIQLLSQQHIFHNFLNVEALFPKYFWVNILNYELNMNIHNLYIQNLYDKNIHIFLNLIFYH